MGCVSLLLLHHPYFNESGRKIVEKALRHIKDQLKTALQDDKKGKETGSKDKLKRAQKQQQALKSLIKKMRVEYQEIFQPDSIGTIDRSQTQETGKDPDGRPPMYIFYSYVRKRLSTMDQTF